MRPSSLYLFICFEVLREIRVHVRYKKTDFSRVLNFITDVLLMYCYIQILQTAFKFILAFIGILFYSVSCKLIINKDTHLVTHKKWEKGFLFCQMIRVNLHHVARRWIVKQINLHLSSLHKGKDEIESFYLISM